MELIYTSLLLHKAHKDITEESMKKVLNAVGIDKADGEIKAAVAALKDVNIEEAIKEASFAPAAAAPAADGAKPEAKKEEPEEQKKSADEAAAGLGALFG